MTAAFLIAATVMLAALVPAGIVIARGEPADALVAYQFATAVVVLVFMLLPQAFGRAALFELPVLLALLAYGGGLVFVRALERWI
ncbi:MAG TPA: hypothetical protein VH478_05300 [Trebonia sp.]|nr:hypothetical protein [Trebonia sp.]